jgi:hypothetical protein
VANGEDNRLLLQIMSQQMKEITFADVYGLGLIATNPNANQSDIIDRLSPQAQKIAKAIKNPSRASKDAKTAAQEFRKLAKAIRSDSRD